MNNKKKAIIIGNGIATSLIGLLINCHFEVCKITDSKDERKVYPFYSNDIAKGIMRQFCEDVNLSFDIDEAEPHKLQIGSLWGTIDCEFQIESFQNALIDKYPKYESCIEELFHTIKELGLEWISFLENHFSCKGLKMKYSVKYNGTTLKQYLERIGIDDIGLTELLFTLLPIREVTLPVYAGYVYTQYFDHHVLKEDVWSELENPCAQKSTIKQVADINQLTVGTEVMDGESVLEEADCIVDLRIKEPLQLYENNNKVVIRGTVTSDCFDGDYEYHINLQEEKNIRIWKILYNSQSYEKEAKDWQFELTVPKRESGEYSIVIDKVQTELRDFFGKEVTINKDQLLYGEYFQRNFNCKDGAGYTWAFNVKQSRMDPTNMFKKHKDNYLQCSHWGFAYFSQAYHIYNIIMQQMDFNNDKLLVKLK